MTYDWFNLFSLPEFLATNLISRTLKVTLEGLGNKEILITRGNEISLIYDGTFLPLMFNGKNPYVRDGYAIFKDIDQNVWFGIEADPS